MEERTSQHDEDGVSDLEKVKEYVESKMVAALTPTKEEKPKPNRAEKRQWAKDLRREHVRVTMPDMANEYRAKRRQKRLAANKTRNKNRRLAKR